MIAYVQPFTMSIDENLSSHAEYELRRAGLFDKDSDYEGMLGNAVLDLVKLFASQGHSGFSAQSVIAIFTKIANWDTLTPITSDTEEWEDVTKYGDPNEPLWQNKRCPRFFSEDGGKTWWDVDKKKIQSVQEAFYNAGKASQILERLDELGIRMWALWSKNFYENLFGTIDNIDELVSTYRKEYDRHKNSNSKIEVLYALFYFFDYRRNELSNNERITESGGEKPKWFTMTEIQWKYFDQRIRNYSEFGNSILASIKSKNYKCSEAQLRQLKRIVSGEDKPGNYHSKT